MRSPEFSSPERERRSYESCEKEHEGKFRERLRELIPDFLEIKEKMGIGDDIGLGFLYAIHEGESQSLGTLPELKGKQLENLKYSAPGMITGVEYVNLSEQDRANILLMPNLKAKNKRIVSVYDFYSDNPEIVNLLEAPDAIIGVIIHELSHVFDGRNDRLKLPPEMQDILKKRMQDFDSGKKSFRNRNEFWGNEEAEVEIIGALFGYKEQIVSKIDFTLQRFGKIQDKWGDSYRIGRVSVGDLLQELEFRKQQVLEYCS